MEFIPKTVVIPCAGLGTRVKSLTKSSCKEMLLYNDLPLIEHAIYEAARAGFSRIICITNHKKKDLNRHLGLFPKVELLFQDTPLGLGHAVLQAKDKIKDNFFGILLPDGVPSRDVFPELIKTCSTYSAPGLAVMPVPKEMVSYYGVIDPLRLKPLYGRIRGIVEKPDIDAAPSNLGIIGRYIVDQGIFSRLEANSGDNLELTPYLRPDSVYWMYSGKFWDGGDPNSYG